MTAPAADEFKLADIPAPEHQDENGNPLPAEDGSTDGLTTGTEHEAEGHGAKPGLPQLDVSSFAGQLFWLVISFVTLYLVISRVAIPKIGGVLADRQARIKGDLDSAAEAKRASEAALANYEKALADARGRALKVSEEIRNQVQAESNAKNDTASKQLAADTQKAEARIAEMRAGAMSRLGAIARDTAAEIVQKLTGESVPANELDAAINSALKRV
ncbi:MAG: F0F1 ATP synthase subunit B' [Micropepsaceae bacterium]